MNNFYYKKYLKYKYKYNYTKNQIGGILLSKLPVFSKWIPRDYEKLISSYPKHTKNPHVRARAIMGPHATLPYCGNIANLMYSQVDFENIKFVIMLAPLHNVVSNYFVPEFNVINCGNFRFIKIWDKKNDIANYRQTSNEPFKTEHSWIAHIPFLLYYMKLRDITILPILIGDINHKRLAKLLFGIVHGRNDVLIIVSTDFTHAYISPKVTLETIREQDNISISQIINNDTNALKRNDNLCGKHAVLVWLYLNILLGYTADLETIAYGTSNRDKPVKTNDYIVSYIGISLKSK